MAFDGKQMQTDENRSKQNLFNSGLNELITEGQCFWLISQNNDNDQRPDYNQTSNKQIKPKQFNFQSTALRTPGLSAFTEYYSVTRRTKAYSVSTHQWIADQTDKEDECVNAVEEHF